MGDFSALLSGVGMGLREYFPLLFVGGVVGLFSVIFTIAYLTIKNNKEDIVLEKKRGGGVGKSVSAKEVQKCLSECRHILEFKEH